MYGYFGVNGPKYEKIVKKWYFPLIKYAVYFKRRKFKGI